MARLFLRSRPPKMQRLSNEILEQIVQDVLFSEYGADKLYTYVHELWDLELPRMMINKQIYEVARRVVSTDSLALQIKSTTEPPDDWDGWDDWDRWDAMWVNDRAQRWLVQQQEFAPTIKMACFDALNMFPAAATALMNELLQRFSNLTVLKLWGCIGPYENDLFLLPTLPASLRDLRLWNTSLAIPDLAKKLEAAAGITSLELVGLRGHSTPEDQQHYGQLPHVTRLQIACAENQHTSPFLKLFPKLEYLSLCRSPCITRDLFLERLLPPSLTVLELDIALPIYARPNGVVNSLGDILCAERLPNLKVLNLDHSMMDIDLDYPDLTEHSEKLFMSLRHILELCMSLGALERRQSQAFDIVQALQSASTKGMPHFKQMKIHWRYDRSSNSVHVDPTETVTAILKKSRFKQVSPGNPHEALYQREAPISTKLYYELPSFDARVS